MTIFPECRQLKGRNGWDFEIFNGHEHISGRVDNLITADQMNHDSDGGWQNKWRSMGMPFQGKSLLLPYESQLAFPISDLYMGNMTEANTAPAFWNIWNIFSREDISCLGTARGGNDASKAAIKRINIGSLYFYSSDQDIMDVYRPNKR
jgi:hypothetical protein